MLICFVIKPLLPSSAPFMWMWICSNKITCLNLLKEFVISVTRKKCKADKEAYAEGNGRRE